MVSRKKLGRKYERTYFYCEKMGIDEDLERWEREKPHYRELKEYVCSFLEDLIKKNGVDVTIQARIKKDLHLYKKLVEKRNRKKYSYNQVRDKLGIRIICKFKEEIPIICKVIDTNFKVKKTDNFYEKYSYNKQGYKGIHKDVKLKEDDKQVRKFKKLIFEIQIRTMCDNVWADIYHDIGYKPERMLDRKSKRELHCLGGVLEVADGCFSKINIGLKNPESDKLTPEFMLAFLTEPFYKFFASSYDIDYSLDNLLFLMPLLEFDSVQTFKLEMNNFFEIKKDLIMRVAEERRTEFLSNPIISQPEVLVIFYLIGKNEYGLKRLWSSQFSANYLEDLSTWWGHPITVLG